LIFLRSSFKQAASNFFPQRLAANPSPPKKNCRRVVYNFACIRYTAAPLTTALQQCQPDSRLSSIEKAIIKRVSNNLPCGERACHPTLWKIQTLTCASTCAGARARIAQSAAKENSE
jgi:hypothetical protein